MLIKRETLDSNFITIRFVYDEQGRQRFHISAQGRVTEYRYNQWGQHTSSRQFIGTALDVDILSDDTQLLLSDMELWANEQNQSQVQLTEYRYDARGALSSTLGYAKVDSEGQGVTDEAAEYTRYVYDAHGNLLQTFKGIYNHQDKNWINTQLSSVVYDGLGRVISQTSASGTSTTEYLGKGNNNGGEIRMTHKETGLVSIEYYNPYGQTLYQEQSQGNSFREAFRFYDSAGRVTMTRDALGAFTHIFYNEFGQVAYNVNEIGAVIAYQYDLNGQIIEQRAYATLVDTTHWQNSRPNHPLVIATKDDRVTQYVYEQGRLSETLLKSDPDATKKRNNDRVVKFFYDSLGRLISQREGSPTETDFQRATHYFYDKDGLTLGEINADGYLIENRYDNVGRLLTQIRYERQLTAEVMATSDFSRMLAYVQQAGNEYLSSHYFYDAQGRQVGFVNEQGFLTQTLYSAQINDNLDDDHLTRSQSMNWVTETRHYMSPVIVNDGDSLQTLIAVAGTYQQTKSFFDEHGRQTLQVTRANDKTYYDYDTAGRLEKTQVYDRNDRLITGSLTRYNAFGEVVAVVQGEGSHLDDLNHAIDQYGTRYRYDALGRRIAEEGPQGQGQYFYYDAASRLTYNVTMANMQLLSNDKAEVTSDVIAYTHNVFNEVIATESFYEQLVKQSPNNYLSLNDALDHYRPFQGGKDNAIAPSVKALSSRNKNIIINDMTYNVFGQLHTVIDGEGFITYYEYTHFGEIDKKVWAVDNRLLRWEKYAYNDRGQLIQQFYGRNNTYNHNTEVQYDGLNRIKASKDLNGHWSFWNYEEQGRKVITENALKQQNIQTFDAFGRVLTDTDPLQNLTRYQYQDALHRVITTLADGTQEMVDTDLLGNLLYRKRGEVETTRTYNLNGQGLTTTNGEGQTLESNIYDNSGRVFYASQNGALSGYAYDLKNRIVRKDQYIDGAKDTRTFWAYNGLGQWYSKIEGAPDDSIKPPMNFDGLRETHYVYDRNGLLIKEITDPHGLNHYSEYIYNGAGELTHSRIGDANTGQEQVTAYQYDAMGRQTQIILDAADRALTSQMFYDKAGNLISEIDANNHQTWYFYNDLNQRTYKVNPLGEVVYYLYDASGRQFLTQNYAIAIDTSSWSDDENNQDRRLYALKQQLQPSNKDRVELSILDELGRARFILHKIDAEHYQIKEQRFDANNNIIKSLHFDKTLPSYVILDVLNILASGSQDEAIFTVIDALQNLSYQDIDWGNTQTQLGLTEVTENQYDKANRLTVSYDGKNRKEQIIYNDDGLIERKITALINLTTGALSESKIEEYHYVPWTDRLEKKIVDPDGLAIATEYAFDEFGHLVAEKNGEGHISWYMYNVKGERTHSINSLGEVTEYAYDAMGNIYLKRHYSESIDVTNWTMGNPRDFNFKTPTLNPDKDQLTITIRDALNRSRFVWTAINSAETALVEYRYDGVGNVEEIIKYSTEVHYGMNSVIEFAQQGAGKKAVDGIYPFLAQVFENFARITTYDYDGLGRVRQVITDPVKENSPYPEEHLQLSTTYIYDAFGQVIRMAKGTVAAPDQQVSVYRYNQLGLKIAEIRDPHPEEDVEEYVPPVFDGSHSDLEPPVDWNEAISVTTLAEQVTGSGTGDFARASNGEAGVIIESLKRYTLLADELAYDPRSETGSYLIRNFDAVATINGEEIHANFWSLFHNRIMDGGATLTDSALETALHLSSLVENVGGFFGTNYKDHLISHQGDDHFYGLGGDDYFLPGSGNNRLDGGSGNDTFDFRWSAGNHLVNGGKGEDKLLLAGPLTDYRVIPGRYQNSFTLVSATWQSDIRGVEFIEINDGQTLTLDEFFAVMEYEPPQAIQNQVGGVPIVTMSIEPPAADNHSNLSLMTQYLYDGVGRLTRTISPKGNSTWWVYNDQGEAILEINGQGEVVEREYGRNGELIREVAYAERVNTTDWGNLVTDELARPATHTDDREQIFVRDVRGKLRYTLTRSDERRLFVVKETVMDTQTNIVAEKMGMLKNLSDFQLNNILTKLRGESFIDNESSALDVVTSLLTEESPLRLLRYVYDSANRLRFTIDGAGSVVEKRYDALGHVKEEIAYSTVWTTNQTVIDLTEMHGWLGEIVSDSEARSKDRNMTYEYDAAGRMIASVSPQAKFIDRYDPHRWSYLARVKTRYTYNVHDDLFSKIEGILEDITADPDWGRLPTINQRTRTTSYSYDKAGRLQRTDLPGYYSKDDQRFYAEHEKGIKRYTLNEYDALDNLVRTRTFIGYDTKGLPEYITEHFIYDNQSRLRYKIDAEAAIIGYAYDQDGNLTQEIHYEKLLKSPYPYTYSYPDLLSGDTIWELDVLEAIILSSDDDRIVNHYCDNVNRLQATIGQVIDYFTLSDGYPRSAAPETQFTYNAFGEIITSQVKIDINDWANTYAYFDHQGREVLTIDAEGYATRKTYDAVNNLESVIEYATRIPLNDLTTRPPKVSAFQSNKKDRSQRYEYDGAGRILHVIQEDTEHAVRIGESVATHSSDIVITTHRYNAFGDLKLTYDASYNRYNFSYDNLGRQIQSVEPSRYVVDFESGEDDNNFFYQKYVRPVIDFQYDHLGNLILHTRSANDGTQAITTAYRYDHLGNRIVEIEANPSYLNEHKKHFGYDVFHRVISESQHVESSRIPVIQTLNALRYQHELYREYQYDKLGRQTVILDYYHDHRGVKQKTGQMRSYNAYGEVVYINSIWGKATEDLYSLSRRRMASYDYNHAGYLTYVKNEQGVTFYQHDLRGLMTQTELVGAININNEDDLAKGRRLTRYRYDALGRQVQTLLPSQTTYGAIGAITRRTYDRWGNVISLSQPGHNSSVSALNVTRYEYNHQNLVVKQILPTTELYQYANGQSITSNNELESYLGQVVQYFDYDKTGNLLQERQQAINISHQNTVEQRARQQYFDFFGQLTRIEDFTGRKTEYSYDSRGNRVGVRDASRIQLFAYDRHNRLIEQGIWRNYNPTTEKAAHRMINKRYYYDSVGQLYAQLNGSLPPSGIYVTGDVIYQQYDERGLLMAKQSGWEAFRDVYTEYRYDVLGNKIYERAAGDLANEALTWQYNLGGAYQTLGQLVSRTSLQDRNIDTYHYDYTRFGEVEREYHIYTNSSTFTDYIFYEYYANGLLQSKEDRFYSFNFPVILGVEIDRRVYSEYEYDLMGQITKASHEDRNNQNTSKSEIEYRYTQAGALTQVNNNVDTRIRPSNKPRNIIETGITINYKLDAWGNRIEIDSDHLIDEFVAGVGWVFNDNKTMRYTYDEQGRITAEYRTETRYNFANSSPYDLSFDRLLAFEYDAAGRRSYYHKTRNKYQNNVVQDTLKNTYRYRYNDLNLLTRVDERIGDSNGWQIIEEHAYDYLDRGWKVRTDNTDGYTLWIYDVDGKLSHQYSWDEDDKRIASILYDYQDNGLIDYYRQVEHINDDKTLVYDYDYIQTDQGKKIKTIIVDPETDQERLGTTNSYDVRGRLLSAQTTQYNVDTNREQLVLRYFAYNADGQIMARQTLLDNEWDHQFFMYFNGQALADFGHDRIHISPTETDTLFQGETAQYQVRAGDTLISIAQSLLGDGNLWYVIAEANGLVGRHASTAFTAQDEGRTLSIPKVNGYERNTSTTFQPYNPADVIGSQTPSFAPPPPPPPSQNACDTVFSIITVAVVAVISAVVTYYTAGALGPLMGKLMGATLGKIAAGAAGAMAGNAAAQATTFVLTETHAQINGYENEWGFDDWAFAASGALSVVNQAASLWNPSNIFLQGLKEAGKIAANIGINESAKALSQQGDYEFDEFAVLNSTASSIATQGLSRKLPIGEGFWAQTASGAIQSSIALGGNALYGLGIPSHKRQKEHMESALMGFGSSLASTAGSAAGASIGSKLGQRTGNFFHGLFNKGETERKSSKDVLQNYKPLSPLPDLVIDAENLPTDEVAFDSTVEASRNGDKEIKAQLLLLENELNISKDHEDMEAWAANYLNELNSEKNKIFSEINATNVTSDTSIGAQFTFDPLNREMAIENRHRLYDSLGLAIDAPQGGLLDFGLWTGASLLNESYQGLQFIGKSAMSLGTLDFWMGDGRYNPFLSQYDSLIGENALFGTPNTLLGAMGQKQGVVASFFIDPIELFIPIAKLGKFSRASRLFDFAGSAMVATRGIVSKQADRGFSLVNNFALDTVDMVNDFSSYASSLVGKFDSGFGMQWAVEGASNQHLSFSKSSNHSGLASGVSKKYGSLSGDNRKRYDRYIKNKKTKTPLLTPDEWYEKAKVIWHNRKGGNAFEKAVLENLLVSGGKSKITNALGHLPDRIPDLPIGVPYGVTDVKDVIELNKTDQLLVFSEFAYDNGLPFNIIISPRTQHIAAPVLDMIRATGGFLIEVDLGKQTLHALDIGESGWWKRKEHYNLLYPNEN
ncbi:MAG: putative toxin [Pseudomonadota bacterium]